MNSRRTFRAAAVMIAGLGCLLVVAGLGDPPRVANWLAPESELRLPPSAAAWVGFDSPVGDDGLLRAGDTSGGAVTYLKFEVPERAAPAGARLELIGAGQPLPELVELVAVPDTRWDPAALTWQTAPPLGRVMGSVRPAGQAVSFELDGWIGAPGTYAFAVTVPADRGHAVFAGAGGADEPALWLPASPAGPPSATPSSTAPSSAAPSSAVPSSAAPPAGPMPLASPAPPAAPPRCRLGDQLVPTCGVLWGVAPGAHTAAAGPASLATFEAETGRRQDIYHAYHRSTELFPTPEEREIAAGGRLLFLNWKPLRWTWAEVAGGAADSYLDRLAEHIGATFPAPFFFTVHHEPENDVRNWARSGWRAADYAAMYRHVVRRLRAGGVDNLVTVMAYLAYEPWNTKPWFAELYPGDDVIDWIAWDTYAYSDPGYGHGDFGEMVNRRSSRYPRWPGFYSWATAQFPDKPFMLAEWGVWYSRRNPGHMAGFYDTVASQTPLFPRVKAMVYFDTPSDQRGQDSRPAATRDGLAAYRRLGAYPYFQVEPPSRTVGAIGAGP